ncbi:S8 family serine peptidase [Comamonas sp. JUb58]|uniref:discoidin domain-containing protein n=1 Tax=Comamonas sp. JUb58 TaxID=2485114 RepID=UPI00106230FA|nr:S8 family serine peptidase [Comamonas sp. JUb58]
MLNPIFVSSVSKESYGDADPQETLHSASGQSLDLPSAYLRAAEELSETHNFEKYAFFGPLEPAFLVWLTPNALERLRKDERISSINEVDAKKNITISEASPPVISGDVTSLNEVASWGVGAVNASGAGNGEFNNVIYVVDGKPTGMHSGAVNDLNFTFVKDAVTSQYDYYENDHRLHVAHVMGIIGAKKNSSNVVGVNPNQPIRLISAMMGGTNQNTPGDVLIDPNTWDQALDNITLGLDFAALDAEAQGVFSVLSVSYNGPAFNHFGETGMAVRRASNRLLVVQSAGNDNSNACNFSYNNPKDNDGIVVVGGIKQNGTRFLPEDGGYMGLPTPSVGSNYGSCVDLWAPGFNITSLDFFDGKRRVSTGTSFSAPFTAAVASRWGNNSTRPIVREQLLKLHSQSGAAGKLVKYGTHSVGNATKQLPVFKVSELGSSVDIPKLRNAKYYPASDMHVFPGNSGSLIADLGTAKNVYGVRLTLVTSANGNGINPATFKVYGSNDGVNYTLIGNTSETRQINWGPVFVSANSTSHRYLKIEGYNPVSYLGYSEVEVYGN